MRIRASIAVVRQAGRFMHPTTSDIRFSTDVARHPMSIEDKSDQAKRAISTGKLNALPRLHTRPINVVVYHGS